METDHFYQSLIRAFPFNPTSQQDIALQMLAKFVTDEKSSQNKIFILKGFAGTGKTTIIGVLTKKLWGIKKKAVLAAPTGRAAKVMTNYSDYQAFTIHRKIYYPVKKGVKIEFTLQKNKYTDTVFIVDEASMISNYNMGGEFSGESSLLDDLISYVYSGKNCQLILIGDTAQLPPVNMDISPALEAEKLSLNYQKEVDELELTEVVRQKQQSSILQNATALRENINNGFFEGFKFDTGMGKDLVRLIDGEEIMNTIGDAYAQSGHEETVLIVRSNKRANLYNQQIRSRILFREDEIAAGDFLMVVKNNYFWLKPSSEAGFIANGDIVEILEIYSLKELYGFRFARVKVQMVDYPGMKPFETVIMLDTLHIHAPSLPYEDSNRLYEEVKKDYLDIQSNYRKYLKIKNNIYFNALQVKFSYAITCHKSQGGQWKNVFVEQPYLKDGQTDKEYLRWLYTACTRASENLYLIGFKDDFFEE